MDSKGKAFGSRPAGREKLKKIKRRRVAQTFRGKVWAKGTLAGGALRVPMEHEILYTLLFPYWFFDSLEASISQIQGYSPRIPGVNAKR